MSYVRDRSPPGKKGHFVVLEGIDGSGKTSVGKEVVESLEVQGIRAHFTFEPSTLPVGRLLREVLKGDLTVDPHTHALLFAADREEHLREEVLPKVKEGMVVVCDRYIYASMAYQGAKGVDLREIWRMNSALPHFTVPDLTLLLDVPPEISLARTGHREQADIFEVPEYLHRVREIYLSLVEDHNIGIIDASMAFRDVVDRVLGEILKLW